MDIEILKNGKVNPKEIEDLRETIGWDRSEGIYEQVLQLHYAYYTARSAHDNLIGYVSVLSDGIADALLLDLMVHPEYQRTGLGKQLVRRAVTDIKQTGVRCIHVTFNENLEEFYSECSFHIFKGGIIDFKE